MLNVLRDRNKRYSSSLLCFIIICILAVCTANESPEFEKLSMAGSDGTGSIASPGTGFFDIVSDEIKGSTVNESIVSKKPASKRAAGFGTPFTGAAAGELFAAAGICAFFLLYFYCGTETSHHFIITYIHDLDGMKP